LKILKYEKGICKIVYLIFLSWCHINSILFARLECLGCQ